MAERADANAVAEISDFQRHLAGKYLTFYLADEEYAVEILKVQEIIQMQNVTKVPRVPPFVRGIINLRGKVIPILELRIKFGMDSVEDTDKTAIVVIKISNGESDVTTGIIIDDVKEVKDLEAGNIEAAPSFGTDIDTDFIMGICKAETNVSILLDIDKILTDKEVSSLTKMN